MPKYIEIHDALKAQIEDGVWAIGARIPSERDLAEEFKVTRLTLRQAISSLVNEGILESRRGAGNFVTGNRVRERMLGTTSFTDLVKAQGKQPSSRIVSYRKLKPNDLERENLQLTALDEIIKMERVRFADGEPICYEVTCVPYGLVKGFDRSEISEHFFKTLSDAGFDIGRSEQTISAKLASKEIAENLAVKPDSAILAIRQISYLRDDKPFEYVQSQYAADRFEFYLER